MADVLDEGPFLHVYFTALPDGAGLAAELERPGRLDERAEIIN